MSQKKKILFVMESLRIGGAEKSLLTLLSMLDYEKYDVSLFLFRHNGELMQFLPEEVQLLPEDKVYQIFDQNWKTAPLNYLKKGDIKRFWHSALYVLGCIKQRILRKPLYIGWNHVKELFSVQGFQTDIAVAYLERKCTYFVQEKVSAKKKIGFVHNDYSVYPYDFQLDNKAFAAYNWIATVSEHCKDVLINKFPSYKEKFVVIKNMVSPQMIRNMARQPLTDNILVSPEEKVIVTVGRLVPQKGYDIAVNVCKELVQQGLRIKWYAVGDGPERKALQDQIDKAGLHDVFILVGAQTNPYQWMNLADIYVQPSRFEGFGITVAEAKVLGKPIVCSDIPEFREQLKIYSNVYFSKDIDDYAELVKKELNNPNPHENTGARADVEPLKLFNKMLTEDVLG